MAGKQPNQVRGNIIQCPNFVQCTLCYGCRNCDMRLNECRECYEQGKGSNRNFNVCNIVSSIYRCFAPIYTLIKI